MPSHEKASSETLPRFDKSTRWFHWTFVIPFLLLAASGAILLCREALQLSSAQIQNVIEFHKVSGLALLILPALIFFSGNTRAVLADLKIPFRWTPNDVEWLKRQPLAALGKATLPPADKLNAGQKINAILSMLFALGFSVSGIFLWRNPAALAACALHIALFFFWLPAFGGHLYLAAINPSTRHALRGITLGTVRRDWAEHHHAAWVQSLDSERDPRGEA